VKQPIPKTKLPQAAARSQWRAWLERNHKSKLEKFAGLLAELCADTGGLHWWRPEATG